MSTSSLVTGTNVLAIQIHMATLDSSDLSMIPWLIADCALVAPGARWRFLRGSAPLPADWKEPDFDDSAWEEGPAGIGYGDGDDVTDLLDGRDPTARCFVARRSTSTPWTGWRRSRCGSPTTTASSFSSTVPRACAAAQKGPRTGAEDRTAVDAS
jgi:hypothetical protein